LCIGVILNISNTALLSANPNTLNFNALVGNSASPQTVSVSSTGESVTYTPTGAVTSPAGGTWLIVGGGGAASSGNPSNFIVGVNSQALSAGVYKGSIT